MTSAGRCIYMFLFGAGLKGRTLSTSEGYDMSIYLWKGTILSASSVSPGQEEHFTLTSPVGHAAKLEKRHQAPVSFLPVTLISFQLFIKQIEGNLSTGLSPTVEVSK